MKKKERKKKGAIEKERNKKKIPLLIYMRSLARRERATAHVMGGLKAVRACKQLGLVVLGLGLVVGPGVSLEALQPDQKTRLDRRDARQDRRADRTEKHQDRRADRREHRQEKRQDR